MPKKLLLVDASNHAYRAYHAIQSDMRSVDGFPTRALFGFARMLLALNREHKPDYVAVVFDNGKSFRNAIYPQYKGQRPDMPDDLRRQWPELMPLARAFGFFVVDEINTEADDIIGTLAVRFASDDLLVQIVSGDKDFCQLVTPSIHVLDLIKGVEIGPEEVVSRWGVTPDRMIDLLSLMGDSSDNVPGIAGVGEKKAAQYLQRFGTADGVVANAAIIGGKTGEVIAASADAVAMARRLVCIKTDMPVACELEEMVPKGPDAERLRELLSRYNFKSMLADLKLKPAAPTVEIGAFTAGKGKVVWGAKDLRSLLGAIREAGQVAITTELVAEAAAGSLLASGQPDPEGAPLRMVHLAFRGAGGVTAVSVPADDRTLGILGEILAEEKVGKLGYDLKAEAKLLSRFGIPLQGLSGDVLLADYLLDPDTKHGLDDICERLGIARTKAPWEIAQLSLEIAERQAPELDRQELTRIYQEIELPLVPILADMERAGIGVDVPALLELAAELEQRIAVHVKGIHELAGEEFNVNSTQKLATILYDKLGLAGAKRTKFGLSTDADTLQKLGHPLADAVLAYRELAKLKSTYVDALPKAVSPRDGRIHTTFAQAVAATGRLSSNDPNLQNIPIRSEEGRRIRHCFVAKPGHVFLSADYSQIELRVLAHYCQGGPLLESFQNEEDIHRRTAAEIFGVSPLLVTADQRRAAKAINFGIAYGMSTARLANDLRIPRSEAQSFIDGYFARYPQVRAYMEESVRKAREVGYATTLFGRRRPVHNITASNPNERGAAERIAINTPIQGTAAELIKLAMVAVKRALVGSPAVMLLQVHDELLFEVPVDGVDTLKGQVKAAMEGVPGLDAPLRVEVGVGTTWDKAH